MVSSHSSCISRREAFRAHTDTDACRFHVSQQQTPRGAIFSLPVSSSAAAAVKSLDQDVQPDSEAARRRGKMSGSRKRGSKGETRGRDVPPHPLPLMQLTNAPVLLFLGCLHHVANTHALSEPRTFLEKPEQH